jgi:hypothetical protein
MKITLLGLVKHLPILKSHYVLKVALISSRCEGRVLLSLVPRLSNFETMGPIEHVSTQNFTKIIQMPFCVSGSKHDVCLHI